MPSHVLVSPFLMCFNKILWLRDHNARPRISRSIIVAFEAIAFLYRVWSPKCMCLQTDGLSMCPHCAESCGHYATGRQPLAALFLLFYTQTFCVQVDVHATNMWQCPVCQCTNVLNTLGYNILLWEFSIKNACWMVRIHCDAILINQLKMHASALYLKYLIEWKIWLYNI